MTPRRRTLGVLLVLCVSTGVIASSAIGLAAPASASPYPSWSEVQAAKKNQAKAAKAISELDDAITTLQQRAGSANDSASGAGERYQVAVLAEQDAQSTLAGLQKKKAKAAASAEKSRQEVGQLVAELSHTGGGQLTVTMLTESDKASDLLYQLGTMSNLTSRTSGLLDQARQDEKVASSLADQASAAKKALAAKTKAASDALATANDLAATAAAAVATQQKSQDQLIKQVAYLKGTTAAVEKKYYEGQAVGTIADISPSAPAASTGSGSTGSGATGSGSGGSSSGGSSSPAPSPSKSTSPAPAPSPSRSTAPAPTPSKSPTPAPAPAPAPAPSTGTPAAVTTAMNFAKAQLGKTYVWGGAGPNVWDCSGLMMGSYNAAGVYIGGHSVRWQYDYLNGQGRLVSISSMKLGDILFYYNGTDGMYHDAMYVGNGQMLEAPNPNAKVRIVAVRYFQLYAVGRPVG